MCKIDIEETREGSRKRTKIVLHYVNYDAEKNNSSEKWPYLSAEVAVQRPVTASQACEIVFKEVTKTGKVTINCHEAVTKLHRACTLHSAGKNIWCTG